MILAYKDGEEFIREQVESILGQTHRNLSLYVFDDASDLPYSEVSRRLDLPTPRVTASRRERNVGLAANFLMGLREAGDNHDYYAYADQDDLWREEKIARAIAHLAPHADRPALYGSNLDSIDETGALIARGLTQPVRFPRLRIPSFANLLVESVFNGCAMVMNKPARDLVIASVASLPRGTLGEGSGRAPSLYNAHDHWTHIMVEGTGGKVIFDEESLVEWRRHGSVASGFRHVPTLSERIAIKLRMLLGKDRQDTDMIAAQLAANRERLTPENRLVLDRFSRARNSWLPLRAWLMIRAGIRRQTARRNLSLMVEVLLNRV